VELCSRTPPQDAELRNHALRAAKSVALNTAEGAPLTGKARKRFFRTARASLVEVVAAYEIADKLGENVPLCKIMQAADEIYAMLTKLMQHEG
jgi:four helix bundle protein